MRTIPLAVIALLFAHFISAQQVFSVSGKKDSSATAASPPIYTFVEQNPEYPGGELEILKLIRKNLVYPKMEWDNKIEGKVLLRFVVEPDGSVSNVEVVRGVSPGIDKEAVRVIKLLGKFKPGRQQGKAVRVYYNLPVGFRLN